MFALKNSGVVRQFTNKLNSIRPKFHVRKYTTSAEIQTILDTDFIQTSQSNHSVSLLSTYVEPELKKNGAIYEEVYQDMIREISDFQKFTLKPNDFNGVSDHFIKMMDYTLSGGHRQHLNVCVDMYRDLMANKKITTENIKQAYRLGWCIELQLVGYMIADDIIDLSDIRRNKKCWHNLDGMGRIAVNDMLMVESGCNLILSRYFGHLPCYSSMIKTVTETFMASLMGHTLEIQYNQMDLEHFTISNYTYSAEMKGSYYRFYQPAALACLLAGYDLNADKKVFDDIKRITHTIGAFYQAQNDFYDCFADQLNKPGHDIENRKFSWLAAMAMELGSEEQKEVMRKNYGKYDVDCVAKVKQLYNDLQLQEMFADWKKRNQNEVMQQINQLLSSDETLRNACTNYFKYAYYY